MEPEFLNQEALERAQHKKSALELKINELAVSFSESGDEGERKAIRIRISELMMKYFRFDQQLEYMSRMAMCPDKELTSQYAARQLLGGQKHVFDGLAFVEALADALKGYDPAKAEAGGFCAYFSTPYRRALNREIEQQYQISKSQAVSIPQKVTRRLKKLNALVKLHGQQSLDDLPDAVRQSIAAQMDISEEELDALIELELRKKAVPNSVSTSEGETCDVLNLQADHAAQATMESPERIDALRAMIEQLCLVPDGDCEKMLLTNALLEPISKDDLSVGEQTLYQDALMRAEDALWAHLLLRSYLDFIFGTGKAGPEDWQPDTVQRIIEGIAHDRLQMPLQNKSIALHTKLTNARISQIRSKLHQKLAKSTAGKLCEYLGSF